MDPRRHEAHERLEQARRYRALIDVVRALLDGRMTRAQAGVWIREHADESRPTSSDIAATVFASLEHIDAHDDGGELVREEFGWHHAIRFCAVGTSRPFFALQDDRPAHPVTIHKLRSDPWRDAVIDLFETLAIDEHDVAYLDPRIDLAQLPCWALWREDDNVNRFEIDRFHSYAKAIAQEQMYTARGHRQFYWVDPAS